MEMASKIELCTWTDFSLTSVEKLKACSADRVRVQDALCEILGKAKSTSQDLIELDLFAYTLAFGINQNFTAAQISTLLSIMKRLHTMCISTAFDNQLEAFTYCKELILKHSINRPPFSTRLFSPAEVKVITDYILSTYFKHYKLYKYVFTKRILLNISLSYPDLGEESHSEDEQNEQEDATEVVQEETKGKNGENGHSE